MPDLLTSTPVRPGHRTPLAAGLFNLGLALLLILSGRAAEPATRTLYTNDLERLPAGALPDELFALNGAFELRKEGMQTFLELPGAPLETFGLLFGPTCDPESDPGVIVSASVRAQSKGRRYPAFGVGAYGVGGFRLQVTPAKRTLELRRGDNLLASQPYRWESDSWTRLRLQVQRRDDRWEVKGKAWPVGQPEPSAWAISHRASRAPFSGRASLWGIPCSGTPIRFDDLAVEAPLIDR